MTRPESAGIVFGGGFPRKDNVGVRRAGQRAIYFVQREFESAAEAEGLFSRPYATWCTRQMVRDAVGAFARTRGLESSSESEYSK